MKKRITALLAIIAFGVFGMTRAVEAPTAYASRAIYDLDKELTGVQAVMTETGYSDLTKEDVKATIQNRLKKVLNGLKKAMDDRKQSIETLSKQGYKELETLLEKVIDPMREKLKQLREKIKGSEFVKSKFYQDLIDDLKKVAQKRIEELRTFMKEQPEKARELISKHFVKKIENTIESVQNAAKSIKENFGKGSPSLWNRIKAGFKGFWGGDQAK